MGGDIDGQRARSPFSHLIQQPSTSGFLNSAIIHHYDPDAALYQRGSRLGWIETSLDSPAFTQSVPDQTHNRIILRENDRDTLRAEC